MSGRQTDRGGLSPSARSLLEAARDADGPKPEDRERVRRALAVALAASAGTAGVTASAASGAKAIASATASTATAGAGATSVASVAASAVLTKVAIAVVALGVGSGAIVAVNHYTSAPQARQREASSQHETATSRSAVDRGAPVLVIPDEIEEPVVEIAPAPEETPAPIEIAPTEVARVEIPPTPARRPHATRVDAQGDDIAAEYELLRDARLQTATPERRLASVDAHAARFPSGQLAPDRDGRRRVAVRDLCAEGPEAVDRYLASHPQSSSAPLLRATCGSSH